MTATDHLISLHKREEALRAESLTVIEADAALSDHWNLVAEAMTAIWAFSHDHVSRSEDELALQLLGIRLFNAAGSSIKLAMAGYYQGAFAHVRDVIETDYLVDYFSTDAAEIDEWRRTEKRMTQFRAGRIRDALDKRDAYTSGERKKIYDILSEYAIHVSYAGLRMITTGPRNMAQVGPFFDEQKLRAWLGEMAIRFSHSAMVLLSNSDGNDMTLLVARAHYLEVLNTWWSKYRGIGALGGGSTLEPVRF
jgi:hypothetical protein